MPEEEGESPIALLGKQLDAMVERNRSLEEENEQLKQEVTRLKAQLSSLKAQNSDRKSALWKKLQTSINGSDDAPEPKPRMVVQSNMPEEPITVQENSCSRLDPIEIPAGKGRAPRVPKPPPKPSLTSRSSSNVANGKAAVPPPPPPPPLPRLPSKLQGGYSAAVKRVPEVMELYRLLTRRDARADSKAGVPGNPTAANARNMIGEIENRSAHLLAIKSDVETQGEFIAFLIREVENAAYAEISDVEAFVKWLDEELSYLVDERAVLKHFPRWPERKADAMREAAFSYHDLKNLEMEVSSFQDNPNQPTTLALKRMQALQDKLERSVHTVERMRESASKRYKEFQIPWEWMLDSGIISQLKSSSMRLAKEYMKRVAKEIQSTSRCCKETEDLTLQGVRFAFRVHQFVGGFNAESMQAFQELRKAATIDAQNETHSFNATPVLL